MKMFYFDEASKLPEKLFDNTATKAVNKMLKKLHRKTDPQTSIDAAKTSATKTNKVILETLKIKRIEHEDGFTATDIAILSELPRDTVTPALSRLNAAGMVQKMDYTKKPVLDNTKTKKQQVWKIK